MQTAELEKYNDQLQHERLELLQELSHNREGFRYKAEDARDVLPRTISDQEPYGGTDDINLTKEEGVDYEPPDAPPRPQRRGS